MARGRATTVEQEFRIRDLFRMGFSPAQIWRDLGESGLLGEEPISMKTVERRVQELKGSDQYEPWSLADATEEEVRLIPEVLADLVTESNGYGWIDKKDAKWIARVRTACPSVPLGVALVLGEAYRRALGNPHRLELLDLIVAFRPWESRATLESWTEALRVITVRNQEATQPWYAYIQQCLVLSSPDARLTTGTGGSPSNVRMNPGQFLVHPEP